MANYVVGQPAEKRTEALAFSWSTVLAGGVSGAVLTLSFLVLGAGLGLHVAQQIGAEPHWFTGGLIYAFAAQVFGFAVAGYIAGRLMGIEPEPLKEEEVRAGIHGITAWAISALIVSVISARVAPGQSLSGWITTDWIATDLSRTERALHEIRAVWFALALLFGAVVAIFASIFARLEDDKELGRAAKPLVGNRAG